MLHLSGRIIGGQTAADIALLICIRGDLISYMLKAVNPWFSLFPADTMAPFWLSKHPVNPYNPVCNDYSKIFCLTLSNIFKENYFVLANCISARLAYGYFCPSTTKGRCFIDFFVVGAGASDKVPSVLVSEPLRLAFHILPLKCNQLFETKTKPANNLSVKQYLYPRSSKIQMLQN